MNAKATNIYHAPNRKLADLPGGAGAFWQRVALAQSGGVQFLHDPKYVTHTRDDAIEAKRRGYLVIVRAKGEGFQNYPSDTMSAIKEFAGVADIIIVGGNEPTPGALWTWAYNLEQIWLQCSQAAQDARLTLCAPAFDGMAEPLQRPPAGTDWQDITLPIGVRLAARVYQVLELFSMFAAHCYGEHVLDGHIVRLLRWLAALPGKKLLVSEIGICARDLISLQIDPAHYDASGYLKAQRCAQFIQQALAQVPGLVGVSRYIDSCSTAEWGTFNLAGVFTATGTKSYWLTDLQLAWFGQCVIRDA